MKYLFIAYGLILIDQITKLLIMALLKEPVAIISSIVSFTLQINQNIAFSIPILQSFIIPFLICIIITGSIVSYFYLDWNNLYYGMSFSLILSGACGNLIDRVIHGGVIDFIKIGFWPTFNIADACITIGAALIIWIQMKQFLKPHPKKT